MAPSLEERVELLEAKLAIREVVDRYAHTLDKTTLTKQMVDAEEFAALATDDIVSPFFICFPVLCG